MNKNNIPKPTDSELKILQILWEYGPSSVRFVNDKLNNEEKEVGYTTTLKIMQIMSDKQLVLRNTDNRTHIYESQVEENATKQELLKNFVDATFRGSAMKLVMQALGNHEASQDELQKIKDLIKQIESEK